MNYHKNGRYLMRILDTDICSYVMKERPAEVLERFDTHPINQLCISAITQAELLYGAERLQSRKLNLMLGRFLARLQVLPWPEQAALVYARKRFELEKAGTPIGNMDLLIASHAIVIGATVVTNNTRHFSKVPGLVFENWVDN
uniref:VapC toxin protein n=1 Tax=uncultured Thiotrichaceae bacterium TaxID=298394 RepID=A0A6S6SBW5_9GAMM|nr:MAG: VapC toxin protein [uncultured Thiotrichaceae bacterium]